MSKKYQKVNTKDEPEVNKCEIFNENHDDNKYFLKEQIGYLSQTEPSRIVIITNTKIFILILSMIVIICSSFYIGVTVNTNEKKNEACIRNNDFTSNLSSKKKVEDGFDALTGVMDLQKDLPIIKDKSKLYNEEVMNGSIKNVNNEDNGVKEGNDTANSDEKFNEYENNNKDDVTNPVEEAAKNSNDYENKTDDDGEKFTINKSIIDESLKESNKPFWQGPDLSRLFPNDKDLIAALPKPLIDYIDFYKKSMANPGNKTRFLIYSCHRNCGGLGNRLIGILNTLAIAIETERIFIIDWTYPFPLQNSMEPAILNWAMALHFLKTNLTKDYGSSKNITKMGLAGSSLFHDVRFTYRRERILKIKSNSDVVDIIYSQGSILKKGINHHLILLRTWFLKMLFRPSQALQILLNQRTNDLGLDLGAPYVAVHMRMGLQKDLKLAATKKMKNKNHDAQFHEKTYFDDARPRHTLADIKVFERCSLKMSNLIAKEFNSSKLPQIFLASDSIPAKIKFKKLSEESEAASKVFYFKDIAFHVDRSIRREKGAHKIKLEETALEHAKLGDRMMWVDFLLLAGSECTVLSKSSFSYTATLFSRDITPKGLCFAKFDECLKDSIRHRIDKSLWGLRQGVEIHYFKKAI